MTPLQKSAPGAIPPLQLLTEQCITFPAGLVGCPHWRQFTLKAVREDVPMWALQSLDDPEVCFLVVDPWQVWPDYEVAVDETTLRAVANELLGRAASFAQELYLGPEPHGGCRLLS